MIFVKRGLSPVVASVLLIFVVIVLSGLIFSWARGFVDDTSKDSGFSSDATCDSLDFYIVVTGRSSEQFSFEAVNRGNFDIGALKFSASRDDGSSKMIDSNVLIPAGKAVTGSVSISDYSKVEEIEVFAVLSGEMVGSSSDVVCVKDSVNFDDFFDYTTAT